MKRIIYNPLTPRQIQWFLDNGVPIDTRALDEAEAENARADTDE